MTPTSKSSWEELCSSEGMAIIYIVETTVAGVKAFHAEEPGWRCHRQAHNDEDTAIRCAQRRADKGSNE